MTIFRQIKFEIRNILKSKFLLIMAILIMAVGVAVPVISALAGNSSNNYVPEPTIGPVYREGVDYKPVPGKDGMESLTIKGITIYADNPFYWNLQSLLSEKSNFENGGFTFKYPASQDLMIELVDQEIDYYLMFAQYLTTYNDYRTELAYSGIESVYEKFFLSKYEAGVDVLSEVAMYRKGMDPSYIMERYINVTAAEREAGIAEAEEAMANLKEIVVNNDFPKYIAMKIDQANVQIENLRETIAIQQKAIIDNPDQEENLSQYIEQLEKQIDAIETSTIPMLEYRLEKNIIPGLQIWQNTAISDVENSKNQLAYMTIMTEEEWNNSRGDGGVIYDGKGDYYYGGYGYGYETYQDYVAYMQKQIDNLNKTIIIAQKSLDTNMPDMKYVPLGSRSRTASFLDYSMIVALFGVLLGGWLIASEFQQGTIRLLMIRPKTRTKILLSKFAAALVVWLVIDLASSLLNFFANGVLFGFADFANPNYTVTGQIGFLAFYLPHLLACLVPILFTFTLAFMLSVLIKNIAVAIALPVVLYIASFIVMNIFAYRSDMAWIAWTPIPFMQISAFFSQYSMVYYIIQNGVNLNLTYGILLLLFLSAVFTAISAVVFKKRDIVN